MSKAVARRSLIAMCLAAAALWPVAATAQDRDDREESGIGDMSRALRDPLNQAKVAATLSALSGMLLSTDVTPFNRAMDSVDGGHRAAEMPGATVGDLAGRDARDLPYDLARKTPEAMGHLAGMLGAFDAMRPQFQDLGRTLKRQLRDQGLAGD